MKKHGKHRYIGQLVIACMLLMIMPVPGMAENGTITIQCAVPGHAYELYQLFTGDVTAADEGDGWIVTNAQWGNAMETQDLRHCLQEFLYAFAKQGNAAQELKDFVGNLTKSRTGQFRDYNEEATAAQAVAAMGAIPTSYWVTSALNPQLKNYVIPRLVKASAYTSTYADGGYTLSGVPAGYYLLVDHLNLEGNEDALDLASDVCHLVTIPAQGMTIAVKTDLPTLTKEVQEGNAWTKSTEADTGDEIQFRLIASVPDYLDDYDDYTILFHDTLPEGTSFLRVDRVVQLAYREDRIDNAEALVNVNSWSIDPNDISESTKTFSVRVAIKENKIRKVSQKYVCVYYTVKLNENAVIGEDGNVNTAYLSYSNDPSSEDSFGRTPDDANTVYTFGIQVHKTDASNEALKGARFELQKFDAATKQFAFVQTQPEEGVSVSDIPFTGLASGFYKLAEVKAPDGYNMLEAPIYFRIQSEYNQDAGRTLRDVHYTRFSGYVPGSGSGAENTGLNVSGLDVTFTLTAKKTGEVSVINQAGSVLPSTGGNGRGIYLAAGSIMILLSSILLARKIRG